VSFRWLEQPSGGAVAFLSEKMRRAHEAASQEIVEIARVRAPRRTSQYAGSLRADVDGLSASIGSPLPQAGAVERGANVGRRRGPHMRGQASVRPAAQQYGHAFTERMRSG
jgi:hypothetical protein